ncbi:MAG: hypothetical protein Q9192_008018 [Flavoplaca navasiana]
MAGLLIAGIILAMVNHIFYERLNGKTARSRENAWDRDDQAWSTRFGTAIALLAKTCFAGAVAIAYQQHIWSNFRDADYTMERIGGMFAAIDNPFSFFHWEMVANAKIATLLALVVCVDSIASTSLESGVRAVPSIDFMRNSSFSIGDTLQVSPALERLAVWTGASKNLSQIAMPIANASYLVEFLGPSVQCRTPSEDETTGVWETIESIHNATSNQLGRQSGVTWGPIKGPGEVVYMATAPKSLSNDSFETFVQDCVIGSGRCDILSDERYKDVLWIRHQKEDIVCDLHQTKYNVGFYSTRTTPHMVLWNHKILDRIADPLLSYRSITQSLVNLLTGAIGFWSTENDCEDDQVLNKKKPTGKDKVCGNVTIFTSARTKIWSTLLVGALNLTKTRETPETYWDRLTPSISSEDRAVTRNLSLGPLIEELSRKLTLNLFSDAYFL